LQVPPSSHAVDTHIHVNAGSLWLESEPPHPVQTVGLMHPVQLLLQGKVSMKKYFRQRSNLIFYFIYFIKIKK
jgi:hypothetical protein